MGYNTDFDGTLYFTKSLFDDEIRHLNSILGEDIRDHPEWGIGKQDFCWIALQFNSEFTGLVWDGSEKTYAMENQIKVIIELMQRVMPDFGLEGTLLAQGADISDRFTIHVKDNKITLRPDSLFYDGKEIICPHCHKSLL